MICEMETGREIKYHQELNPSNAEATFIQSTKLQIFFKIL